MTQVARHVSGDNVAREVLGWLYVYLWVKRANLRAALEKGAIGVLIFFLVLLGVDLVLEFYWHKVFEGASLALKLVFGAAFAVALYYKLREWRERRQEYLYIGSARVIAEILSDERVVDDGTIERLLAIFHKTFEPNRSICVTLAVLDGNRLKVQYRYPSSERRDETTFEMGEGAAGYSASCKCTVYIPRKRFGHAVLQKIETQEGRVTYDYLSGIYAQRPGDLAYESVMSVPIVIYGRCYGALSFDSARPNAFRILDLALASFYGSVMAQVLQARQGAVGTLGGTLTKGEIGE